MANEDRSRAVQVTRGIRQGCPLAPLLFVLALGPLYQQLDSPGDHIGVPIQTDSYTFPLRVAGYTDDTAIYLGSPSQLGPVLRTVRCFGDVSGLILDEDKKTAIALRETDPSADTT